jgi:iron complex outermembrane receptor protein
MMVSIGLVAAALGFGQAPTVRTVEIRVRGDGAPLPEAIVTVDSLSRRTGADGSVRFAVEPGSHRATIRRVGWRPDSLAFTIAARDTVIAVELEPVATEVEELVVSTSRIPRRVEDEPLRVEVLDLEEIEEKQLMTPGDVVMLLNETGGVRAQTTNPSLGAVGIRIRGLAGRYTQVLADGLPLFGEQVGGFGPLQIPPLDLGQVEVIKGTASALFGGSALGGVVNLLSRPPTPGGTLLLNGTTLGGADLVGFAGGALSERWSYTLLGGTHAQTGHDRDDDGWREVPGYRRGVVRPRLFWRDDSGQSLLMTAGATVESRYGGTDDGRVAPDGAPFVERLATTRFDAGLVGRWRAGGDGPWIQARASATSNQHRHRFGASEEPDRHRTGFGEVTVSDRVAELDWLAGAAITVDRFASDRYPANSHRYAVPGAFGQVERDFGRVSLAASARLDRHNRFGTFLSPRLSGLFRLGPGWSLRGSIGGGYFAPSVLIEEVERVGLARVVPPIGLQAERAVSGSLDLSGVAGNLEIEASVFGSRIRDQVALRRPPALGLLELVNLSTPTTARGVDLSLRYRRGPVAVSASYTLVDTRERDADRNETGTTPLTPRHSGGLVAVHEGPRGRVGVELYYTGKQRLEHNPFRDESAPYWIVGVLAERRFGPIGLFINFENLTDVRQSDYQPLLLPARAGDGRWTTDGWAPLDGRVVNGGVRWSW